MQQKDPSKVSRGAVLPRIVSILIVLVLLSTSMLSGLYARYTTSIGGSDSARVARFAVTEEGELLSFFTVDIQPGSTVSRSVTVENKSEVAVEYSILPASKYGNLPLQFQSVSSAGTSVLQPGQTEEYTLNITWPADQNSTEYCGMVDLIQLTLQAAQVD